MPSVMTGLDLLRAWLLRATLRHSVLRKIFVSRSLRLLCFFLGSVLFNLYFSLAAPIWLLALGPIVFGIPHLFAGLRYVPFILGAAERRPKNDSQLGTQADDRGETHSKKLIQILFLILFSISALRIMQSLRVPLPVPLSRTDAWEWGALLAVIGLFLFSARLRLVEVPRLLVLLPLAWSSWSYPVQTTGLLLLGHNFIAFFYWINSARKTCEKKVAWSALAVFTALTVALFAGLFDSVQTRIEIPFSFGHAFFGPRLDPVFVAQLIFPQSLNFVLLGHALSAYAFGQALHYFVWLKAIPEQTLEQEVPLSFRQSRRATVEAFGPKLFRFAVVLSLGLVVSAWFFRLDLVRQFYLTGVTAHGYLEFAGLPFLFRKRSSAR